MNYRIILSLILQNLGIFLCWYFLLSPYIYRIEYSLFLGLLYTYFATVYWPWLGYSGKIFKFIIPIGYLLFTLSAISYNGIFVGLHPVIIAFVVFTIASYLSQQTKWATHFFMLFFIYLYSFAIADSYWRRELIIAELKNYTIEQKTTDLPQKAEKNNFPLLQHYRFLNAALDTIGVYSPEKYTIIETWNERCPPCMKAIPEMHDFYVQLAEQVQQYYLYVPASKKPLDYNKVFFFDKIKAKDRIIADIHFQKDAGLSSYPVFLVFNKAGEQVFLFEGYDSSIKDSLQKQILEVMIE